MLSATQYEVAIYIVNAEFVNVPQFRHRVHFRKLGRCCNLLLLFFLAQFLFRTTSHRISLLRTQTTQLIEHERIKTTVAKAKELRRPVEQVFLCYYFYIKVCITFLALKMITLAKRGQDDMHARIQARAWVQVFMFGFVA